MTVMMTYPGVLASTVGLNRVLTREANGFPDQGLQALYLFENGAGTAVDDTRGGADALIEHPVASNNAFSWLSGGGGLQIEGTEIVTFPEFNVTGPWTVVSAGAMVGSVGGTASERISMALGFRDWVTGNYRGAVLIVRGGTNWNTPTTAPFYQLRGTNGAGGLGTAISLTPSAGLPIIDAPGLRTLSYNGTDTLTATAYDADGALVATGTLAVTDASLTTGTGSVVDTTLQLIIGGANATYNGGQQQIEALARYNRVLSPAEIAAVHAAAAALGADRGRPW